MLSVIAILGIGSYEVLLGTLSVGSMVAFYLCAATLWTSVWGDGYLRSPSTRGCEHAPVVEVEQAQISLFDHPNAVDVTPNTRHIWN